MPLAVLNTTAGAAGPSASCGLPCADAGASGRLPPRLVGAGRFLYPRPLPPLGPLGPADLGPLTNSVPIAGPLLDKFTSPPWVFVLGVILISAAHATNPPYGHGKGRLCARV